MNYYGIPRPGLVQWIHPSYRDLVIEQLSMDASLRGRFLRLMDLEGLKLTVSQAGGGRGDRRLPLLVSDDDWLLLAARSLQLVDEMGTPGALWMLTIFRSAMVDTTGADRTRLSKILGDCCDAVRKRLDAAQDVLKASQLQELFEATVLVDPLPALPQLGPTWKAATVAFRATIRDAVEESFSIDAAVVKEWVHLAGLLATNEPRFMRQAGYPEAFAGDLAQLAAIVRREVAADGSAFDDPEELLGEAEHMATLEKALNKLSEILPSVRHEMSELASLASAQEDYLREEYRESNPRQEEEYDGGEASSSRSEAFDVDELFSDL